MRLLPPRATIDGEILGDLVSPFVGIRVKSQNADLDAGAAASADLTGDDRERTLPSALDLASWFGSREARDALHDAHADDYPGYARALDALSAMHTVDPRTRHASVYRSTLDAIEIFLGPSMSDAVEPAFASAPWRRRKVDAALSQWTTLRHDESPRAYSPPVTAPLEVPKVTTAIALIEPHPEAIAALLGTVRQLARGLADLDAVPRGAISTTLLARVDTALTTALDVALRESNGESLNASDYARIAAIPSALDSLTLPADRDLALVAAVHIDIKNARILEQATGTIDDLYVVMREPGTSKMILTVGASIPHYEFAERVALSDASWRERLARNPPPRAPFTASFVVPK
jgi:hypothetical protein